MKKYILRLRNSFENLEEEIDQLEWFVTFVSEGRRNIVVIETGESLEEVKDHWFVWFAEEDMEGELLA